MAGKVNGYSDDVGNWLRGICMGSADIVPGVSGGTMALILGHYERLITAISHIDRKLLSMLRAKRWRDALEYTDFRFLVGLGLGIVTGILALATLLHYLLENHQAYTYSVFSGLIIGSSVLVAQRLKRWSMPSVISMLVGALFAWQLCVLQPMAGTLNPMTAFLAATVAICAMILPGISGAFVLLLLGLYHPITELIKGLPKGEVTFDGLVIVAAFGTGCLIGLLSFSRVLKWLLSNRHDSTLAFLCGLMIGSLYKIWPFQQVTEETKNLEFKEQRFDLIWPWESSANLLFVVLLCVLAVAGTLAMERLGKRFGESSATAT